MFKRVAIFLTLIVLFSGFSLDALGQTAGGTISGVLVNGTPNGSSVADADLRLETYVNNQLTANSSAKSGADGSFKFDNLPTDAQHAYRVALTFQDAGYSSADIKFAQGEASKSANVTVYDSTNDTSVITLDTAHVIITPGQKELELTVVYDFMNSSNRTYIGSGEPMANGKRKTLSFNVPADATDVQYGVGFEPQYVFPSHEGFIDTMAVPPGIREVVYAYKAPLTGGSYRFSQKLNYAASWFNLLVEGEKIKVTSDQLADQGPLDMGQGSKYIYYVGHNFAAGQTVSVTLSGLAGETDMVLIIVGAVALLIVLGGIFAVWRMKTNRKLKPVAKVSASDDTEQNLLHEIARLDDDFAEGRIPEDAYRAQRAQKKALLVKLMSGKRG